MMREGARIAPERSCSEFVDALTAINDGIEDPVDKLKYLRTSLNLHPDSERALRWVPLPQVRRWLARAICFATLQRYLRVDGTGRAARIHDELLQSLARTRLVALALFGVLGTAVALFAARELDDIAATIDWKGTDLFPHFGMPAL